VDYGLLPKAYFGLRRMNVHIHFRGRHLQKQQHYRKNCWRQNIPIRIGNGVLNKAVPNDALIHKHKNRIAVQLLDFWLTDKTVYPDLSRFGCSLIFLGIAT